MDGVSLATKLCALNLAAMPVKGDGSKQPAFGRDYAMASWDEFQLRRPTADEIPRLWDNGQVMGIATGVGSGNLEVIDFDDPSMFPIWKDLNDPAIIAKLVIIQTPGGGFHCYYRAKRIEGNQVLARSKDEHVAIETRGLGGYVVCPPTKGYKKYQGAYAHIPTLSAIERDELLATARQLNEGIIPMVKAPKPARGDNANVEAWASGFDMRAYLESHGWKFQRVSGRNELYTRPGKPGGTSATWNGDVFHVFSTEAGFPAAGGYSKWAVVTMLDYGGDYSASSKALFTRPKPAPSVVQKPYETSEVVDQESGEIHPPLLHIQQFGADFMPSKAQHLVYPYLQMGKSHLWDADGGTHKTGAVIAFAAYLSRGRNPLTLQECEPVRTLYLHKGEDLSEELETVFRGNNGDPAMIAYSLAPELLLDAPGIERIGNTIVDFKAGLLVLDAFFYFLLGLMKSTNDNLPALQVMQPYNAMLAATKAAAIDIRHTTKGRLEKEASELGMGSQQFRNSHRGQLVARYDPDDKTENKRVIVTDEKGSLLNPRGKPFAFRRDGLEIQFVRNEEIDNPFVSPEQDGFDRRSSKASPKLDACKVWLLSILANTAYRSDTLIGRGADVGFQKPMIYKARKELTQIVTRNEVNLDSAGRPHVWWAIEGYAWENVEAFKPYDPYTDE